MWGDYAAESICKQYIFHRAVLLNTEIIITTFPKPLIKSARNVGTYEGSLVTAAFAVKTSDQTTAQMG